MSICFDPSCGKAIVVDFERKERLHRAVRWTSDRELLETLLKQPEYLLELRQRFEKAGGTVLSINAVELHQVALL